MKTKTLRIIVTVFTILMTLNACSVFEGAPEKSADPVQETALTCKGSIGITPYEVDAGDTELVNSVLVTCTEAGTEKLQALGNVAQDSVEAVDDNDEGTISTNWFSGNIPEEVITIKTNTTGGATLPEPARTMTDDAGVLGCDNLEDANANPSCIWTGGADHQTAQGPTVGVLIPEGSYVTAYADRFHVEGGGYTLDFPSCGEHCAWGLLVRGWHLETHADRNLGIEISEYGTTGAMKYTRYPVPAGAGEFFSQGYLTDQAINALSFDNCGIGLQAGQPDCDTFQQAIFDYNDGSLTVLRYTKAAGWRLLYTNIIGYGR